MPQNDLLMELLLGGGQPDPTSQFIAQAFLEGRTPGDQGAAMQNVLTNLSPNVIAERRRLGPQPGEGLGLPQEDTEQALQQILGLRMSPVEARDQELNTLKFMSEFLTTQAGEKRAERETKVKEKGADVEQAKLDLQQARDQSLIAYREALEDRASAAAESEQDILALRKLARATNHPDGRPITPEESRFYFLLAGGRADPQDAHKLGLAEKMLYSGYPKDREFAANMIAQVTGYDTSSFADPVTGIAGMMNSVRGLFPGGDAGAGAEAGAFAGEGAGDVTDLERQAIEEQLEAMTQQLINELRPE